MNDPTERRDPARREFLLSAAEALLVAKVAGAASPLDAVPQPPAEIHLGMGFRVGEVTQTSAIVWTRVTARREPNWNGTPPKPRVSPTRAMVKNAAIAPDDYEGAMPGAAGQVRVAWSEQADLADARWSDWVEVRPEFDFTHQFTLCKLQPGTRYYLRIEARDAQGAVREQTEIGSFTTAQSAEVWQDVRFTVITCQQYYDRDDPRGFKIFPAMGRVQPNFFVSTGDNVYLDRDNPRASTVPLCRLHWNRMYALPKIVEFCRNVPGYWEKDDHDGYFDDCWPEYEAPWIAPLTYAEAGRVYREQVPIGPHMYRTIRWGQALQIWLLEVRDFRSPSTMPDGPDKSIWGRRQKEWLMRTLAASDAAFRVIVSPTAIVGPDYPGQTDNHADAAFAHESREFRHWCQAQGMKNLFICNGDRHWQYMSTDPETGLREFACGPASDAHAVAGPGKDERYHSFYRPKGGFVSIQVSRAASTAEIALRFHDVDGNVLHEYRQPSG